MLSVAEEKEEVNETHKDANIFAGITAVRRSWAKGEAHLLAFCSELSADQRKKRRLQRKLDRQRRANNPQNYDEKGRVKKGKKHWHDSGGYKATRQYLAAQERRLSAHRQSLHGRLAHEIVSIGNTVITEKLSYKAWQKQYGKSVGAHAPGMFIETLSRTVARTGGILHEVPTSSTKLSQYCHGCGEYVKKPLSQRWHDCPCGIGPVQRDLYSADLPCHLDLRTSVPSLAHEMWEGAEPRLRAAMEDVYERATAGELFPQSVGMPSAGARRLESLVHPLSQDSAYLDMAMSLIRGFAKAYKPAVGTIYKLKRH